MKAKIIHISDVHFGDPTFSDNLKFNILSQIQDKNPDMIIFAGDLTYTGHLNEYDNAKEFIDELKSITEVHVVPGNHDARNVGLVHFENLIGKPIFKRESGKIVILGLDSAREDINDGNIGPFQLEWLKSELEKAPKNFGKIVVLHHHLIPIPQTGRERNILLDCGDLLQLLLDYNVDLVLGGHKHVPNVVTLENMAIINSGTATTRRVRGNGHPCYSELILNDEDLNAYIIFTENGAKKPVAKYTFEETDEGVKMRSHKNEAAYRIRP
jgi:putative phosphoesterase